VRAVAADDVLGTDGDLLPIPACAAPAHGDGDRFVSGVRDVGPERLIP
jgi:hypothetical protein